MEGNSVIYNRKISENIDSIVDKNGKFNFGTYNKAIPNINMFSAHNPLGYKAPKWFNNMRLKEWEAFQMGNEEFFVFGAIYTAKISAIIVLEIYNKISKEIISIYKFASPSKINIGDGMLNSITSYETKDFNIKIHNNLENNEIYIRANLAETKRNPKINLDITAYHINEPIVTCMPLGENRAIYSHKSLMPMEGSLFIDNYKAQFKKENSNLIVDDHKGYYPYKLKYDWVTAWGKDISGNTIGFNLTDNQVIDKENYNENCVWINDKMFPLPPIKVERNYGKKEIWHIKDKYNTIDLHFYPERKSKLKINALIICCDYEAPMGRFEGYIKVEDRKIELKKFFGMGEKKYYRM